MTLVEICFWIAAAAVIYPYALYPVLAWALARLRKRPIQATTPAPRSASIVVAAYNEEEDIARRLDETTALLTAAELDAEVILVTDGSTDATAAVARAHPSPMVRVVELPARVGKAAALSEGCAVAVHEILVFADVRQSWSVDALPRMLSNFMDPTVGAVSGDLIVQRSAGVLGGRAAVGPKSFQRLPTASLGASA